mmetsp:Transcript_28397/g.71317  ORF Transcript_28397/g.71317 Transcript_28397/m.71317 type:complete len:200 (+) Transcript_28397:77-676(+)|eukprot:CAMPEP_0177681724 /NCGR_PEP_ID=MMETSP0447-20121125/30877_1 /TAXON_ID=0 /ORGANISM="Stygamoeba regulata, Strain BSH-02190019" /LENGTH=199 /DNA_ID=CAMNT_0019191177 /DNA_START=74 /DNA_END=673 /DNA_ORIENTATION=+
MTIARVLLAGVLLSCVLFATLPLSAAQDCHQVPNCTDVSRDSIPLARTFDSDSHTFHSCVRVKVIGDLCLDVTAVENTDHTFMNISLSLRLDGKVLFETKDATWPDLISGNGICLDDATILEILELTMPMYIPLYQNLLDLFGCIPGGIFSVCIQSTPQGCFSLTADLLYFEHWCVTKGVVDFGCHQDIQLAQLAAQYF